MEFAAYYFPNYHQDAHNADFHGKGWTEWELMKCARSRFEGHRQPRIPLWGYEDEADPAVMAKKIDAAVQAGLDAFVFDWYWYDSPFLQRALDEGYLQAPNCGKMKFALMWANHDWYDRHPIGFKKAENPDLLYPWNSTYEGIGETWDYIIERYMTRPEYWRVNGLPYFSIYNVNRFIQKMGGPEKTKEVLALLREKACKAGLPGVHINAIWYDNLEGLPFCVCSPKLWSEQVGFSSYTSYNSVFTTDIWNAADLTVDFRQAANEYLQLAKKAINTLPAPYYPVVTAGWDVTPRTIQSEPYRKGVYPYCPVMEIDPKAFYDEILALKEALAVKPAGDQIIFFNAWNEWTEGSYLEPDTVFGAKLLEKIRLAK